VIENFKAAVYEGNYVAPKGKIVPRNRKKLIKPEPNPYKKSYKKIVTFLPLSFSQIFKRNVIQ